LAFLGPKWAFAGDIVVSNFGAGLNTYDNPAEIDPSASQGLLNVNIQPGGAAIFKRDGYGLFQTLGSSQAIHGGYHFQQVGGNDVQLWGSSTTLFSSVNDSAFVKVGTGTLGATWQCADSQGYAYCLSSSRDMAIKTDGSSANSSYVNTIPLGTMLTFTPTQLVVAGVSGNESTIYVSSQNAFNGFTVGTLPSSPFTEPIASPGSRITHLAYYFGKLFWWKDQSFGYATFTNQFDWQLTIVSNQVGTLDNSDAFWNSSGFDSGAKFSGTASANAGKSPGGIFFRGQDNHFYVYDGYYLTRLSRPITPTVAAASRKKANAWTQTTQADFQTGISTPTANLSYTISPGNVIVSSFQVVENSSTQWVNGTWSNLSVWPSSITISTNAVEIQNSGFENGNFAGWTASGAGPPTIQTSFSSLSCGAISPKSGTYFAATVNGIYENMHIVLQDAISSAALTSTSIAFSNSCNWNFYSLPASNSNVGRRVRLHFYGGITDLISDSYVYNGNSISFYVAMACRNDGCSAYEAYLLDVIGGTSSSTITTGSFTSQVYNSGFSTTTYTVQSAFTANNSSPTFSLYSGPTNSGPWTQIITSSGTNAVGKQYAYYSSTIALSGSGNYQSYISNVSIIAESTGTYYSAVNNAPNFTSWGTFGADDTLPGISSITYYTRASTGSFTIQSSTPAWVLQSKNATVTASTGTYMQARADFYISAATETPTLNDFQFNWYEGSASDKAYITYFNDAIWFSVSSSSSSSTNNRIFYWDILNGAWLIYDIPANGFLVENNSLYIGSPTSDSVFKFGGVTTDNSAAINSYWRSKSFLGQDPFVQNEFTQADFVLGESSTTLTYTYTLDSKTSTVYTMTAYDSAASLIQRNFLLPVGKIGKYYDFQIGDNSSNAGWRLMGHRTHYNALNWRPVLN